MQSHNNTRRLEPNEGKRKIFSLHFCAESGPRADRLRYYRSGIRSLCKSDTRICHLLGTVRRVRAVRKSLHRKASKAEDRLFSFRNNSQHRPVPRPVTAAFIALMQA